VRKHRLALTTAATIILLLVAGVIVSAWEARRAIAAERDAQRSQATAEIDRDRAQKAEMQAKADRDKAADESKHFQQNDAYHWGLLSMEYRDYASAEKLLLRSLDLARSRQGLEDMETWSIVWNLGTLYAQMKKPEKGEPLLRELRDFQKEHGQADSLPLPYAMTLQVLGTDLLQEHKWAEAESVLRECVAIFDQKEPKMMYNRFSAKSKLGGSLVGQKRYAEAEPYLLEGYQGLKMARDELQQRTQIHVLEAAERLVKLYDAWNKPDAAAKWRRELEHAKEAAKEL
jgi:hypothetical protein